MYSFSPKLKLVSIILLVAGLVLFAGGYFLNSSYDQPAVEQMMEQVAAKGIDAPSHSSEVALENKDHAAHVEHAMHQVHNQPLASMHLVAAFFFGLACCVLFFYAIQHVAHAGWSIIVTRVMEGIAYFIPFAGVVLIIIMLLNVMHYGHLFHWMDPTLVDPDHANFDVIIYEKSKYLNTPFYAVRTFLFVGLATFFAWKLRTLSKKMDETKSREVYKSMYTWNVLYIVFFGFASAAWAWDWLMSIDSHWYSTMYIWYSMVSTLTSGIAAIILISVYLKKKGALPEFNDNHLHDLAKYLFATSMLWTYTWFAQYMLYWYANVPEEANYFFGRFEHYEASYLPMLIPNFLIPLAVMVSSSIKRNYKVVVIMAIIVILGHIWDFFNMVMPGTVGPYWQTASNLLLVLGSVLFFVGLFIYVVMNKMSKLKLIPEGNPFVHESKIFEYPF